MKRGTKGFERWRFTERREREEREKEKRKSLERVQKVANEKRKIFLEGEKNRQTRESQDVLVTKFAPRKILGKVN